MEIKEIKLSNDEVVKIWKMNYGFRSDLKTSVLIKTEKVNSITGKKEEDMELDLGKVFLYTCLYGIWESQYLGIVPPKDVELGFDDEEFKARLRAIRRCELDLTDLHSAINTLNTEISSDVKKK